MNERRRPFGTKIECIPPFLSANTSFILSTSINADLLHDRLLIVDRDGRTAGRCDKCEVFGGRLEEVGDAEEADGRVRVAPNENVLFA